MKIHFRQQIAEANQGGQSYKGTAVRQWLIKNKLNKNK